MDDKIHCDFCDCKFDDLSSFHRHISSSHKIKIAEYYPLKFPRFNLYDNSPIEFKTYEQYFSQDFKDKNQLKKYLKENPGAKQYALDYLIQRREEGKNQFFPGYVELKSLMAPSLEFYLSNFDQRDFNKLTGLKRRFSYNEKVNRIKKSIEIGEIICDTREKKPLEFKLTTKVETLNVGDYSAGNEGIVFDWKTLTDFCGTLGKDYDRFQREIARAAKKDIYLIMIVGCELQRALSFNYAWECRKVKVQPSYIFHNLRKLIQDNENFQAIFVNDREQASDVILKTFQCGRTATKFDLQYELEIGNFK